MDSRRPTEKHLRNLTEKLGSGILMLIEEILKMEIKELANDERVFLPPSQLSPAMARSFTFDKITTAYAEWAPFTWELVRTLSGVGIPDQEAGSEQEGSDSNVGALDNSGRTGPKKKNVRNKVLMASSAMAVMLNSRNERLNHFQNMVTMCGVAHGIPKRSLSLLNRLGVMVSYSTVTRTLRSSAEACLAEMREICTSSPIGVVYDNCNIEERVGTETSTNRSSQAKLTVGFMYKLHAPGESLTGPLERELCLREPDYDNVDVFDLIGLDVIGEFWQREIEALICSVLWEQCGEEMSEVVHDERGDVVAGHKKIKRKVLHKLAPRVDEFYMFPTQKIDPGTSKGNGEVIEIVGELTGLTGEVMLDKVQPFIGDLATTLLQRNLLNYRKRDMEKRRLRHVDPWSGYLHANFALEYAIAAIHQGHPSGGDPCSLNRYKILLGKTKLLVAKPPFHALQAFHWTVLRGMILSAVMEKIKCKDIPSLRQRMKYCKFQHIVKEIAAEYFDLKYVTEEREKRGPALAEDDTGRRRRGGGAHAAAVEQQGPESPAETYDQVRENAMLCMQHLALGRLFHESVRGGDTGSLLRYLNMLTVFFHGTSNHKYATEFLNQLIDRRMVWTPLYEKVFKNSCLVNMSGRTNAWMSLDEVCEIMVDVIKNDYNPRGTMQSQDYHLNVVSTNINMLRLIRDSVMSSAKASTYGIKSAAPDEGKDVMRLCDVMIEEGVFIHTPGRVAQVLKVGENREQRHEVRRYKRSVDAFGDGLAKLRDGAAAATLERRVTKRSLFVDAEVDEMDDLDLQRELDEDEVHQAAVGLLLM